ncbi:MAG: inositol monophosphatase family protein, partial [Bacteroides stercoris]|nr:inositol monophosphatase family protein [Bacteroides stercoris]
KIIYICKESYRTECGTVCSVMTVPIAALQWYRLQCYAWYRFSAIVNEVFSAVKGEGSFLNGKPIHVSSAKKLSETIIGIGTAKRELAKENFTRFLKVYENSQDIRRLGSAALELAYTACGRQGGYFEVYLNPWDYAAGILLVEEAGGKVTDWIGNKLNPRQGNQVIGTNGNIHQELLRIL